MEKTYRGFDLFRFRDRYDSECSLQKSSLATEDCIWLGVDDASPKVMATKATGVAEVQRVMLDGMAHDDSGWVAYPIPTDVSLNTRMHLTRDQVRVLLPMLTNFVETGRLE